MFGSGSTRSLERLARWASARGLEYVVNAHEPEVLAQFAGEGVGCGGVGSAGVTSAGERCAVEVWVRRTPARMLVDLPSHVTQVRVQWDADDAVGTELLIQPSAWVMQFDGGALPPRVQWGGALPWAAYCDAATGSGLSPALIEAVRTYVDSVLTNTVLTGTAPTNTAPTNTAPTNTAPIEDMALHLGAGRVTLTRPGIATKQAELDQALQVAGGLARTLRAMRARPDQPPGSRARDAHRRDPQSPDA